MNSALSIRLSVCPFDGLSVHLSVHLPVTLFSQDWLLTWLFIRLFLLCTWWKVLKSGWKWMCWYFKENSYVQNREIGHNWAQNQQFSLKLFIMFFWNFAWWGIKKWAKNILHFEGKFILCSKWVKSIIILVIK